ncbi:Serine/threonine-protein phosphatase 7 long form [Glycine max]|nr:Serine/threonine-protein phosphatase 7 long form [Glycine max]
MASSSSCSSNIKIKSGPIDGGVLWMQAKHVSKHVWNGKEDWKLLIRRAVPTYQGEEEIPEEIIPLLRQCDFYWIMKMGYLKISVSLITTLIERWRPETHTFHMRCRECTITLQDVCIIRPQECELQGSVVKLSWLAHHFSQINNHDGNIEQLQRFTRAWILRFIGGVLFVDQSSNKVSLSTYAWGPAVLVFLYREMSSATDYKIKSIGGMCILIQMWAWERCTTLAPKRTPPVIENKPLELRWLRRGNQHIGNDDLIFLWEPYTATAMSALPPICLVGSVAWCAVVPLICFHAVEWHQPDIVLQQFGMQQPILECPSQPLNIHGLTLKGKQAKNWFQLLAPMISQWNNRAEFRIDVYPRQEGLLSFNSDYMVRYRRKMKMFVDPKNANTTTLQHDAPMATPNAPLAPQWNVPKAIPDMGDLLGVDLRQEFSVEAEQVEARRHRGRRNPDHQARRWDRPCGTSSRHHGHHNE